MEQTAILPLLYDFDAVGTLVRLDAHGRLGLFAIILTYAVCRPLEALRPVEQWPERKAVLTDAFFTVLSRIGVLPVTSFLLFYQVQVWVNGLVVKQGYVLPTLETLMPGLLGRPVLTFVIYTLILDCSDSLRHRLSHSFRAWYALHALQHAQRKISFWSDDRNHLLDDLIAGLWFGVIALLIGIPPLQFPLRVLLMR